MEDVLTALSVAENVIDKRGKNRLKICLGTKFKDIRNEIIGKNYPEERLSKTHGYRRLFMKIGKMDCMCDLFAKYFERYYKAISQGNMYYRHSYEELKPGIQKKMALFMKLEDCIDISCIE